MDDRPENGLCYQRCHVSDPQGGKMNLKLLILCLSLLFFVACAGEPVEVTRIVENDVEVTRVVEVTREVVQEVEVTREVELPVEVITEVEVEVTRIVEVEVEVTAVPTQTPTPLPTNTPAPATSSQDTSAPPPAAEPNLEETLLNTMVQTRSNMQNFGGMIDTALNSGGISCEAVVETYDNVVLAPTFDVSGASPAVQGAYGSYRAAIDVFGTGARDMAENCRTAITNNSGTSIGFQQWGLARQQVNNAIDIIHPAIQSLGGD
ncbi:MAG: hypothetical protein WAS33_22710 [Candidatus Promineifilaceae bacterium]|nr:hypothetical protein [Anaerolineaceae bacterium]